MPNTALTTAETVISTQFAATTTKFLAALAALEDPDTLFHAVSELADQAYELGTSLLESGERPLDPVQLIRQVRDQTPENLHHLLGAPAAEWGDPR
ncbi:hypothetical protein ACWIGW_44160 [Nocardia brasiliensis]